VGLRNQAHETGGQTKRTKQTGRAKCLAERATLASPLVSVVGLSGKRQHHNRRFGFAGGLFDEHGSLMKAFPVIG